MELKTDIKENKRSLFQGLGQKPDSNMEEEQLMVVKPVFINKMKKKTNYYDFTN